MEQNQSEDLFKGLKDQRAQNLYFARHYGMTQPTKVDLPSRLADFGRHITGSMQQYKNKQFVYVPILKQLERILNFSDVFDEIFKFVLPNPAILSRFEDGLNYKNSSLFQEYPNALQIHLYLDEVQVCSELGSYTKKNKLVFVYFSVANLKSKLRSTFKFINLLSIFYNSDSVAHGLNTLIRPIIDDLKQLENGVELSINGQPTIIRGTLTAVIADNLASHQIGGFKCGFSKGFRKCRFCMATDEQIQNNFYDSDFVARSKDDHDFQCLGLHVEELKKHFSRLYGVTGESILNELKFFHVIGGLAPDIMHDLLEGVLPLVICETLLHCLKRKYFTITELNQIIANFKYGSHEVIDKPSSIDITHLKKEA